jgi:hypothetical protein
MKEEMSQGPTVIVERGTGELSRLNDRARLLSTNIGEQSQMLRGNTKFIWRGNHQQRKTRRDNAKGAIVGAQMHVPD